MAKGTRRGHQKAVKVQGQEQSKGAFSRRCRETFNQANEFCILNRAQIALIILSSINSAISFGSPSVQFVIDRFINQCEHNRDRNLSSNAKGDDHTAVNQSPRNNEESLHRHLLLLEEEVEKEKKRGEMLDQMIEGHKGKYWWANPMENLEFNQLEELLRANQALHADITKVLEKASNKAPTLMDLPQNATIPYIINRFSSAKGEGSSSASTQDFEEPGVVSGNIQGGGSSRSGDVGVSKMKARFDG